MTRGAQSCPTQILPALHSGKIWVRQLPSYMPVAYSLVMTCTVHVLPFILMSHTKPPTLKTSPPVLGLVQQRRGRDLAGPLAPRRALSCCSTPGPLPGLYTPPLTAARTPTPGAGHARTAPAAWAHACMSPGVSLHQVDDRWMWDHAARLLPGVCCQGRVRVLTGCCAAGLHVSRAGVVLRPALEPSAPQSMPSSAAQPQEDSTDSKI